MNNIVYFGVREGQKRKNSRIYDFYILCFNLEAKTTKEITECYYSGIRYG